MLPWIASFRPRNGFYPGRLAARREDEVDHLVDRRPGLVGGLRDHLRMEEFDHRRAGAQRRRLQIGHLELAGRHALRNHAADGPGDQLHMGHADVPALLHGDLHHLMQLGIADIALRVHAVDGFHELAQADGRRTGPRRDGLCRHLDLAHHDPRDALMDRLFRIEKAIDVRRAHAQHLGDVGDGGLLIADLAKQTLRHHENPLACVGFDMFGNQRHGRAQFGLLDSLFEPDLFAKLLLIFSDPARVFNYSAAAASTNTGWDSP